MNGRRSTADDIVNLVTILQEREFERVGGIASGV